MQADYSLIKPLGVGRCGMEKVTVRRDRRLVRWIGSWMGFHGRSWDNVDVAGVVVVVVVPMAKTRAATRTNTHTRHSRGQHGHVDGICHIFFRLCNASLSFVIGPSLFSVSDSSASNCRRKRAFPSISCF